MKSRRRERFLLVTSCRESAHYEIFEGGCILYDVWTQKQSRDYSRVAFSFCTSLNRYMLLFTFNNASEAAEMYVTYYHICTTCISHVTYLLHLNICPT